METAKVIVGLLILGAGMLEPCMACGGRVEYTAQRHSIQSPNFYQEYGKAANCTWEFNDINRNYGLVLKLRAMRMFYYDVSSDKQCGDSYRLTINGKSVDCMLDIVSGKDAQYYPFYTNPSCTTVECPIGCDDWTEISSPSIQVEYFADGSKPNPNAMDDEMWGFEMQYQYVNCPPAPIATSTTTSMSPTIAASPVTTVLLTTTKSQPTTTSRPTTTSASTTALTTTTPLMTSTSASTTKSQPAKSQPTTTSRPTTTSTTTTTQSSTIGSITSSSSKGIPPIESDGGTSVNEEEGTEESTEEGMEKGTKKGNTPIFAIVGGVCGLALLVIIILVVRCKRKSQKTKNNESGTTDDESGPDMIHNVLYETSEDIISDAGHGSEDPAVTYAIVNKSLEAPKKEKMNSSEVDNSETTSDENNRSSENNGHASVNPTALYVVDKSAKSAETEAPTYAQVHKSGKAASHDNTQSARESNSTSMTTPINQPPVYASVTVHEGGDKSTVHA